MIYIHVIACMSLKLDQIRPCTTELAALEHQKKSHRLKMGKTKSSRFLCCFDRILFMLACNEAPIA